MNDRQRAMAGLDPSVQVDTVSRPTADLTSGTAGYQPPMNDRQKALAGIEGEHDTVSNPTVDLHQGTMGYGNNDRQKAISGQEPGVYSTTADGPVDATGTAGYDPNDPGYIPNQQPRNTAEATAQAETSASQAAAAMARQEDLKVQASRAMQERMAAAYERSAKDMAELNNNWANEQAAISAKADASTATWLQDMADQATREPNPSRWWNHQGGLGRALWGLSMAFGGLKAGLYGGQNAALEMVQQEIDKDVARQGKRIEREGEALKLRGSAIKEKAARDSELARDRHTASMTRLMSLERAYVARATAPGDLDAQAAKAAAQTWFAQNKASRAEQYRQEHKAADEQRARERFQAGQAAIERKFRADQAAIARQHKIDMENLQFGHKLALSPVEVGGSSALGAPGQPSGVNKDGIPVAYEMASRPTADGGIQVALGDASGKKVGEGVVKFKDRETWEAANKAVANADEMYDSMVALRDKLKSGAVGVSVAGVGVMDPEVEALVKKLGYTIAQSQNKQVTDKDYSAGVSQAIGFDPDGNWLQRGKFAAKQDEVVKYLDQAIKNHHKAVEQGLQQFNNGAVNGHDSRILYRPETLRTPDVPQQNAREIEGKPPVTASPDIVDRSVDRVEPVKGAKDYQERVAQEAAGTGEARGALLPDHDRDAVNTVIDSAKFRGPAAIRAKASAVLDSIQKDIDKAIQESRNASDPWYVGPRADKAALDKRISRDIETSTIVESVSKDLEKKAQAALDRFRNRAELFGGKFSDATLRKMARDEGITDATEVEDLIKQHHRK